MPNTLILLLLTTLTTAWVSATDQVVVIKATDAVNVQALKSVQGTAAVYKVKRLNFYKNPKHKGKYNPQVQHFVKTEWNYLVFGKGFANNKEKKAFKKKISSFGFVKAHFSISLKTNPYFNHADINRIMANVPQQNLIKRPLEAASNSGCDRITVDGIDEDGKALFINIAKFRNDNKVKKYTGYLVTRVFPALKVRYVYTAAVKGRVFDTFTILDYRNKETWCEYVLSKLVRKNISKFKKSFKAMLTFSAVEV